VNAGFESSPIHADTWTAAKEILQRTYRPDRWKLRTVRRLESHMGGYRYGFVFRVIPK
jgi:hypothetical protein